MREDSGLDLLLNIICWNVINILFGATQAGQKKNICGLWAHFIHYKVGKCHTYLISDTDRRMHCHAWRNSPCETCILARRICKLGISPCKTVGLQTRLYNVFTTGLRSTSAGRTWMKATMTYFDLWHLIGCTLASPVNLKSYWSESLRDISFSCTLFFDSRQKLYTEKILPTILADNCTYYRHSSSKANKWNSSHTFLLVKNDVMIFIDRTGQIFRISLARTRIT